MTAALTLAVMPATAGATVTRSLNSQSLAVRPSLSKWLAPSILAPSVANRLHAVSGPVPGVRTHPDASRAYIYTCNYYGSDCRVYDFKSHALVNTLTATSDGLSNPQGTSVNWTPARRTWLIANTGASNVLAYSPGGAQQLYAIGDGGQYPVDVTAGFKSDTVYVSNIYSTSFTAGSLGVCNLSGSCSALTDPNAFQGIGVAIDGNGNCYWSYNDNSGVGQIDEFAGCSGNPVNLGITLGFAGGLATDEANNLYYVDQLAGVYKCTGTTNCALLAGGFGAAGMINFTHRYRCLLVADTSGFVDCVDPSSGAVTTLLTQGISDPPFGVAASPATKH